MKAFGRTLVVDWKFVPKLVAIALATQIVRFICLLYRGFSLSAINEYHERVFADDMQKEIESFKALVDARLSARGADGPKGEAADDASWPHAVPREIDLVVSGGGFKASSHRGGRCIMYVSTRRRCPYHGSRDDRYATRRAYAWCSSTRASRLYASPALRRAHKSASSPSRA